MSLHSADLGGLGGPGVQINSDPDPGPFLVDLILYQALSDPDRDLNVTATDLYTPPAFGLGQENF